MNIEPITRVSLVNTVVERLRALIEQGELQTGDRLPTEVEMVEQLGVSRTVVREAVSQLECLGMLTVRRAKGTFVSDWSDLSNCAKLVRSAMAIAPKELLQFTEFREGLECIAARQAAARATPEDVADLESLCEEIDREGRDGLDAMRIDFEFHRRLMDISGNPLMKSVLDMIQEFVLAGMAKVTPNPRDREDSRQVHWAIVEAVRKGDADAAERAMHVHMARTVRNLRAMADDRQQINV